MEILDAYDLTGSLRDAAELAGCSHHTVKRYVEARAKAGPPAPPAKREQLIDPFLPKIEEWVERSQGQDPRRRGPREAGGDGLPGFGALHPPGGREVKTAYRRAPAGAPALDHRARDVAAVRLRRRPGDRRGEDGACSCAWLAWSRFRVVMPIRDKTMPSVFAALDVTFRRLGGAPTYVLTDNEKTVTVEHVAGDRRCGNPQMRRVRAALLGEVHTCLPADPASKGGVGVAVKLAKADLVPTDTNLRAEYALVRRARGGLRGVLEQVNTRVHRVTRRAPVDMLAEEKARLHRSAASPFTVAFGDHPQGPANTPMVSFENGQYSVPHPCSAPRCGSASTARRRRTGDHRPRRRRRAGRGRPSPAGHPGHSPASTTPLPGPTGRAAGPATTSRRPRRGRVPRPR